MEISNRGISLKQQISFVLGLTEISSPEERNDLGPQERLNRETFEPITPSKCEVQFANKTLETESITNEDKTLHDDQGSVNKKPKRRKFKPKVVREDGTKSNKTRNSKSGNSNPGFSPRNPESPVFKIPITPDPKPNNSKVSIAPNPIETPNSKSRNLNPGFCRQNPEPNNSNISIKLDPKLGNSNVSAKTYLKPDKSKVSITPDPNLESSIEVPITPNPKSENQKDTIILDPITPDTGPIIPKDTIILDPIKPAIKKDIIYVRRSKRSLNRNNEAKSLNCNNEAKDIIKYVRKKRGVNVNNEEKTNVDKNRAGMGLNCDDAIVPVQEPVRRRLDFGNEARTGTDSDEFSIGTSQNCENSIKDATFGTESDKVSIGTRQNCENSIKDATVGTESDPIVNKSSLGTGLDCKNLIKESIIGTESDKTLNVNPNCENVIKGFDRLALIENLVDLSIKYFQGVKMKNRQKVRKVTDPKPELNLKQTVKEIILKMKNLNLNSDGYAIVPFVDKKRRAKVALDEETIKEWNIIMGLNHAASSASGANSEKEEFWRAERENFGNLAEWFIAQMKLIQGDRKFSEWKGSVVDSVVGAFLTQNVSDQMSSSAFISLASRFPPNKEDRSRSNWPINNDFEWEITKSNSDSKNMPKTDNDNNNISRGAKKVPKVGKKGYTAGTESIDWDELRWYGHKNWYQKEREFININNNNNIKREDSVNWEAVRNSDVNQVAKAIHDRGMDNVLSERIQDFLNRVADDHGSVDLEWLREIPDQQAKEFLLSIYGLGLKSVECIRLLTLHQIAFPVDTNVGRICVRLGWVPLEPLPESVQIHLLELYPVMDSIQKYLWPRFCKLDQRTLYELHYQMITFGKLLQVFCTKNKPNCNACPLRNKCKHFASSFASARLALPGPNFEPIIKTENQIPFFSNSSKNSEPIIDEPSSPNQEIQENQETLSDIEELFSSDSEEIEIPAIKLDMNSFMKNLEAVVRENDREVRIEDISRALVVLPSVHASIPVPKLKNPGRLRTVHDAYELPDSHAILKWLDFEERVLDDPCPYLLILWTSEKVNKSETEVVPLSEEEKNEYVQGSILIPCRTAMRGSFPLNGTYFQVNEVFADHGTARNPIRVLRDEIWRLRRLPCYFGSSVSTVLKGLPTDTIQFCFWRGFICVREFDRETRSPKPLSPWLHYNPSSNKKKKTPSKAA